MFRGESYETDGIESYKLWQVGIFSQEAAAAAAGSFKLPPLLLPFTDVPRCIKKEWNKKEEEQGKLGIFNIHKCASIKNGMAEQDRLFRLAK